MKIPMRIHIYNQLRAFSSAEQPGTVPTCIPLETIQSQPFRWFLHSRHPAAIPVAEEFSCWRPNVVKVKFTWPRSTNSDARAQSLSSRFSIERDRHTSGFTVFPINRDILGVTDLRSSSDEDSKILSDEFVFQNMSFSSLVTTLLGSSRLLDFPVGDLRGLRFLPE